MNWPKALHTVGPLVLEGVSVANPYIGLILKGIEIAEEVAADDPSKKKDKKQIAVDVIKLAAQVVNQKTGNEVVDVNVATALADGTIDLVVKATNDFHKSSVSSNLPAVNKIS